MPIYEYACTVCGERTEAKQSFDDPPLQECPHCGGKLRKLYSPVGIVFKGSGFYSTDAKKAPVLDSKKPAKKEEKTPAASESKSASTSSTSSKSTDAKK
ncbi:MAG TPA: FmdB family zinc ribbon protein [Actinomycetota bacterium]|nr:FmdB family zinc ribbon protein [Actinomycetota bacterium]